MDKSEVEIEKNKLLMSIVFMVGVLIILIGILLMTVIEIKTEKTTIVVSTAEAMGGERDFTYILKTSNNTSESGIIRLTPNYLVWAYPTYDYIPIEKQIMEHPYESTGLITALVGIIITVFGIAGYFRLYVKLLKVRCAIDNDSKNSLISDKLRGKSI